MLACGSIISILPFSLEKVGREDGEDNIEDVSEEEPPIPGKFMGGKKGKLIGRKIGRLQHAILDRRMKDDGFSKNYSVTDGIADMKKPAKCTDASISDGTSEVVEDTAMEQLGSSFDSKFCFPVTLSPNAEGNDSIYSLYWTGEKIVRQKCSNLEWRTFAVRRNSPKNTAEVKVYLIPSLFGCGSTVLFHHNVLLTFKLPPPEYSLRLPLQPFTVMRKNRNTSLFYKIGPGAVAFRVVLTVFNHSGFTHTRHSSRCNVLWTKRVTPQEWSKANEYQRVNHFPGTWAVGRKDNLSSNLLKMRRAHGPEEYGFFPQTFLIPQDVRLLELEVERFPNQAFIIKPPASSCGKGIRLFNHRLPSNVQSTKDRSEKLNDVIKTAMVIQRYIGNPYLIDGYKFDLRIYVVVTSFEPLRIYLYNEGLVRFATERYVGGDKALNNVFMHLTNYSLNKKSSNFVKPSMGKEAHEGSMGTSLFTSSSSSGANPTDDFHLNASNASAGVNSSCGSGSGSGSGGDVGMGAGGKEEEEDTESESDNEGADRNGMYGASKWTLSALKKYFADVGINWNNINHQIQDIIIKTLFRLKVR